MIGELPLPPFDLSAHKADYARKHPALAVSGEVAFDRATQAKTAITTYHSENPQSEALFQERIPVTEETLKQTRDLLQKVAPVHVTNYRMWLDTNLVSRTAQLIASELKNHDPVAFKDINPNELAVLGLLQGTKDVMEFGQFFNRGDQVARSVLLANNSGIRNDFIAEIPTAADYLDKPPETVNSELQNATVAKKILQMARLIGNYRFDPQGVPVGEKPFDDKVQEHISYLHSLSQSTPVGPGLTTQQSALLEAGYREKWPSEKRTPTEKDIEFYKTYSQCLKTYFSKLGINLETIQQMIADEEAAKPAKVVVFDMGGLAHETPSGTPMIEAIGRMLNKNAQDIEPPFEELMSLYHKGFLDIDSFWQSMVRGFKIGELDQRSVDALNAIFTKSISPTMRPEMRTIIAAIKDATDETGARKYIVGAYTDTNPPHLQLNTESGVFAPFDFLQQSLDVGERKNIVPSHLVLAAKMDLPPQSFIFFDDSNTNVAMANKAGLHAHRVDVTDPMREVPAQLKQAGIEINIAA
jgi:FMN phosphatase YigB (HAD superfamily)